MGEAYTALSDDEGALNYNPAGMSGGFETHISATHIEWFQGIRLEHLGGIYPLGKFGTLGFDFTWMQVDAIPRTVRSSPGNSDPSQRFSTSGQFSPSDSSAGIGYALPFPWWRKLHLGGQFHVVQQTVDLAAGSGPSYKLGAQVDLTPDLILGASMRELGEKITVGSQGAQQPTAYSFGLGYSMFDGDLNMELEGLMPSDNAMEFSGGSEYWLADRFALRAGYKAGYVSQFTAGAGFKYKRIRLDYAFIPYGDLGYTHRITASYVFGSPETAVKADQTLMSARGLAKFKTITIRPSASGTRYLKGWSVTLKDWNGKELRHFSGKGLCPEKLVWDGKDDAGQIVPDCKVTAQLQTTYRHGRKEKSGNLYLEIDSSPPLMAIRADLVYLKPNEAGKVLIPATFSLAASDSHDVAGWRLDILDANSKIFRTYGGPGSPPPRVLWDGTDGKGKYVNTGSVYKTQFTTQDTLGNWSRTPPVAQVVLLREIKVTLSKDLVFESGKAEIGAEFRPALANLAGLIKSKLARNGIVEITGYTDDQPCHTYEFQNNLELSQARAAAVAEALSGYGIPRTTFRTLGKGEADPIADNSMESGRALNRRVEIVIHTQENR